MIETKVEEVRPCTRCDGSQHVLVQSDGFGIYACDTCALRLGFDLQSEGHREFLLHRGDPARYTKDIWGLFKESEKRL